MIVSVEAMKEHLNGVPDADAALITRLIAAAEAFVARYIGRALLADGDTGGPEPADLKHAIMMLAAHWYECREGTLVGVSAVEVPLGVRDILNSYRGWVF